VDRSVVEVFANDRQAVMRRIYPSRADSLGVTLFSLGGAAVVTALEAWDMAPANPCEALITRSLTSRLWKHPS